MQLSDVKERFPNVDYAEDNGKIFASINGHMFASTNPDDIYKCLRYYYQGKKLEEGYERTK